MTELLTLWDCKIFFAAMKIEFENQKAIAHFAKYLHQWIAKLSIPFALNSIEIIEKAIFPTEKILYFE